MHTPRSQRVQQGARATERDREDGSASRERERERINTRADTYRGRINHRKIMHVTSAERVCNGETCISLPPRFSLFVYRPSRSNSCTTTEYVMITGGGFSKTCDGSLPSLRGRSNEHVTSGSMRRCECARTHHEDNLTVNIGIFAG